MDMTASLPSARKVAGAPRDARGRILDAAEALFGERGIDGVSLREIAAAAGQRNNSVVHYHFQDKQGLVDALLQDRVGKVERIRQEMVDAAGDLDRCDLADLLRIMWQSKIDYCAGDSAHWYIQFHLAYHMHGKGRRHPIIAMPTQHPASSRLLAALEARCDHLHSEQFQYRLGLLFTMFWTAVARHDSAVQDSAERWSSRFSLDETIKIAVAALAAPA